MIPEEGGLDESEEGEACRYGVEDEEDFEAFQQRVDDTL